MKDPQQLTPAEFQLMQTLWRSGTEMSVAEVQSQLPAQRDLAYTTVMTLLDKMARKGSLRRRKKGRAYRYRPAVSRAEVLERAIDDFLNDYFGGERRRLADFLDQPLPPPPEAWPAGIEEEEEIDVSLL